MRIISKFHDYYDTAMGLGVDTSLIYRRVNEAINVIEAPRWHYDLREETRRTDWNASSDIRIKSWVYPLIFCGKVYLRAVAEVSYRNPNHFAVPSQLTEVFTAPSRKEVLAKVYTKFRIEPTPDPPGLRRWIHPDNRGKFKEWVLAKDWIPVHIAEGSPVLMLRNLTSEEHSGYSRNGPQLYMIERNPSLKSLGFQQVKAPFEAFQEISMFLGGVMGTAGRPMVVLSDKEVHQKHGFDKWSFRKTPEATK